MDDAKAGELESWAIVEIFGHKKLAGFVRSVPMGGAVMIRIDVPELQEENEEYKAGDYVDGAYKTVVHTRTLPAVQAFTQFLGVASIFSLTPCTEETARRAVRSWRQPPPMVLDAPRALPSPEENR